VGFRGAARRWRREPRITGSRFPFERESVPDRRLAVVRVPAIGVRLRRFGVRLQTCIAAQAKENRMSANITHSTDGSSLAEVVDRILDRGCVIDAFVRVTLVGIELLAIEARVVIASVDTWLKYAEAVGLTTTFEQMSELQS
jgi:hypothetical protein